MTVVKGLFTVILVLILFFLPAGTLDWPEAWIVILLYFLTLTLLVRWLKRKDPELLRERRTARKKKNVKGWDKVIMLLYSLLLVMLVVLGLDAGRFGWSRVPFWWKGIGFFCFFVATAIVTWTMKENTYLSEMVRIQEERGQRVCTGGPYRYLRHPMYLGVIIMVSGFPLALGSWYALIPALLVVILFIIRTALEDRTLQKELTGYREYAQRVRYRLIPGIW
jgi:protein-S-isoprenylcysteine O-methyltransferase Ste14